MEFYRQPIRRNCLKKQESRLALYSRILRQQALSSITKKPVF